MARSKQTQWERWRHPWLLLSVGIVANAVIAPRVSAELRSDQNALGVIFGDDHLANVLDLHRRMSHLSPDEAYPMLRDAVFPPGRHVIRIDFDFSPAHVTEQVAKDYGFADPWSMFRPTDGQHPLSHGGELLAPVIHLVSVARELGKIGAIENLLESRRALLGGDTKELLTVQVLLAIARESLDIAHERMTRFDSLVSSRPIDNAHLGPETVVIWSAAHIRELRDQASVLAFRLHELISQGNVIGSERWRRHLFALVHLLRRRMQEDAPDNKRPVDSIALWRPVTRTTAESNGTGYPLEMWESQSGIVRKVTGHDHDYLYYDTPLVGDFAVEAEVSPFGYGDTRLAFGGIWAGPAYDLKAILNGHFGADDETLVLDPPLDEVGASMRVRLVVNRGMRTTYINGRNVFQARVSASDPWLSIFSIWYTHGWVRDLRISGNVTIPAEIDLATAPDLLGWNSYFGQSLGDQDSDWRLSETSGSDPEEQTRGFVLQGIRHHELAGSFQESLLRYHRPVFEDGVIAYEFFYREGEFAVHPALDRCVFLMDSAGIKVHWIGDGRYERTGIDPANATLEPANRRGDQAMPLRNDAWNRVELSVSGDVVGIRLNGQLLFERELEETNQRTFGLFHYADLSEARVRHIGWRGDWPKVLPAPLDQELADGAVESLLSGPELPHTFEFDFSSGLPIDRFLLSGEDWKENRRQLPGGIRLLLPGKDYYVRNLIAPLLQLEGDFDVVAEFEGFDATIAEGGDSSIHLLVGFEPQSTECILYRKFSRYEKRELGQQIIQAAHFYSIRGERAWEFPKQISESTAAGKLRLVRRRDQLHYLFASENSSHFRLLHTETVPTDPIVAGNVQLILETTKAGHAAVVWKSLKVRAQGLSGLAMQNSVSVAQLDLSRENLSDRIELDFRDEESEHHYRKYGQDTRFQASGEGLLVTAPGFNTWKGHSVVPSVSLSGDFDVTVDLDVKKLELPASGGESVVYLEAEFRDERRTVIESKFAISDRGHTAGEIQLRRVKDSGGFDYKELASVSLKSVSQLRMARRNGLAYFIVNSAGESEPTLLGRLEVGSHPIRQGDLRIMVHTSGEGHETIVLLKRMTIHAESIQSSMK